MRFFRCVHIRIVSPEPEKVLSAMAQQGISIMDAVYLDSLTVNIRIYKAHYQCAKRLLEHKDIHFKVIKKTGYLWCVISAVKRPVMITGLILFFSVTILLPNRILFFDVSGNSKLPEKQILYYATQSGMRFLSKSAVVRSEIVKNQLLSSLPQLQWVGITTSGCCATIHVQERSDFNISEKMNHRASDIIAACEGVITNMTIYSGTPLVSIGQAVASGDILVSGYVDYGQVWKICDVNAEIFAYTEKNATFTAITPKQRVGEALKSHTCYKIQLGKKVINLCNHSRISDASCVKMYLDNYLYLPGHFRLPISISKEIYIQYQVKTIDKLLESIPEWLPAYSIDYIEQQLVAGEILGTKHQWECAGDSGQLTTVYNCHEMIGRLKYEKNVVEDAEDN